MPSSYSSNLKIELQATGENSGTWGTITNTNLGTALEQAIVGYGNPSYASDANLTLTYTDTNAAQAARALVLNVTSAVSLTNTRELVVPTIQKQYIVQNNTTGSQSITVKTSGGTGITVPNGRKAHLYVNGTDVIYMDDYVDINGGAIDGTPIGASSASTGSFTTLGATTGNITTVNATTVDTTNIEVTNIKAKDGTAAASIADSTGVISVTANPILSGGTANGVLYLNASKVATSGSALVFDGTNIGLGITPNSWLSTHKALQGSSFAWVDRTDAIAGFLATNAYRDSTTSNWTYKSTGVSALYQMGGQHIWSYAASGTAGTSITYSEGMRLDTSGNLGIGTSSPGAKLSVNGAATVGTATQASNAVLTLQESASNSSALVMSNRNSTQSWAIAVDAASVDDKILAFIERTGSNVRMALTDTGNLGLGVTPSAWDSTFKNIQIGGSGYSGSFYSQANGDISNGIVLNAYFNAGWKYTASSKAATQYEQNNGVHKWSVAPSGTAGNTITFTQAMTLDASGNLGVGETSPSYSVDVKAPSSGDTTIRLTKSGSINTTIRAVSGAMTFGVDASGGTTERARITSDGDLLVGTTSNSPAGTATKFVVEYSGGSRWGANFNQTVSSSTYYTQIAFSTNGTLVGEIRSNNAATQYNTSSDRRIKENIAPSDDAGSVIDSIEIVKHDWKVGGHVRYGVIAQDLNRVAPEAVSAGDDGDEIEKTWGVDYSKLVPMLIKEVQSLRKRVAGLETK